MNKNQPAEAIVVAGDIWMNWHLAHMQAPQGDSSLSGAVGTTCISWQRGGAALLADLVEAIATDLSRGGSAQFSVRQTSAARKSGEAHPDGDPYQHSYSLWAQYKHDDKPAWRVERFLGTDRFGNGSAQTWQKVRNDSAEAALIVLNDAGLGFRNHPEIWPAALDHRGKDCPWIVLKTAGPLAQGALWEHLHQDFSDRLIVVATVDDLRLSEVQVSRELSWERTAQDVFWELVHNPCVNSLSHCAHVIVSFGPAGAVLLSRQEGESQPIFQCSLIFDPKVVERMWEKDYPGGMIGYTTCLAAGVVRQAMLSPAVPDVHLGIRSGLAAMRTLHLDGYEEMIRSASQAGLVFPIARIVASLAGTADAFAVAPVQDPMRFISPDAAPAGQLLTEGFWTILQDRFEDGLDGVAAQIVLEGPDKVLQGVPWGQFGNLLTIDRQEIESYRSIRNLVSEYAGQKQVSRPLSIAVFGTPGSGKSFGVTEMAKSLLPGQIEPVTFNLSQFDSPNDLLFALHQVRDVGLSGRIPLVFWDEFDTTLNGASLGWLRYFLAPMQDGKFQEGQITHPIGRSIFVFAGGTSSSMADFDGGADQGFRSAKGPDFLSRLKGYINVLGPNPVEGSRGDPYFIIRRAILLRSCFKRGTPQLFEKRGGKESLNIDRGVLRALLKIPQYKHGARSIESLLAMSQLTGKTAFERSCLPSSSQLDLHVDGRKFLSLVQQVELEGQILESLAEAAHAMFCGQLKARGFQYGPQTNEEFKTHSALLPFADLPADLQEANRLNVRDIPAKLAAAGYIMIPARSNEQPFNFPGEPLEVLAEAEHERWMRSHLENGWAYAARPDRAKKLHNCLVPWHELAEDEKDKDRDAVRGIPAILARAGYAIVKSDN